MIRFPKTDVIIINFLIQPFKTIQKQISLKKSVKFREFHVSLLTKYTIICGHKAFLMDDVIDGE